ncbi:MAG TPA: bifunctional trypsin-like peptidase domain-containing/SEL1-like repeat protein [Candidatus Angelobacter sp.]|nr:bifunctional trypsin-like peptidase domain-containing/SEL1-like repeat protein [Candidatus Angelobacter sp.]
MKLVGDTQKYPYLVGVSVGAGVFGSGILLHSRFVLTCNHIGNLEAMKELDDEASLDVVTSSGPVPAGIRAVDREIDLALLELDQSVAGSEPRFTDLSPNCLGALKAVGVQETPGHADRLTVAEIIDLKYANTNKAGGQVLDIQFLGGARPGYSGGAVVESMGGVVGIIRFGGTGALSSNAVGLARIRAFLRQSMADDAVRRTEPFSAADMKDSEVLQLEAAAMRGDQHAQYRLALVYAEPSHPRYKPEAAVRWFRSAADKGHAESAFLLAIACRNGRGVLRSEPEALRWFHKAAMLGHASAQTLWGLMLLDGRAGEKDPMKAIKMFELAAQQGDMEALYQLALLHVEGCAGMPRNEFIALEEFRRVAESGRAEAQFQLAWMLAAGRGLPADPVEALRWAEAAALQHHQAAEELARKLKSTRLPES